MAARPNGESDWRDSSITHLGPIHVADDEFTRPRATTGERESALVQVAVVLLQQGIALLTQTVRTDAQFSQTSKVLPGSSVGKHLRHILDHYRLLLDADELLNYDSRQRNVPLETQRDAALDAMRELVRRFEVDAHKSELTKPLVLQALTPEAQELETTFGRELWFSSLHAIHHYSLIRVIIVGELGLEVPSDFGVAPSTLAFRAASAEERSRNTQPQQPHATADPKSHL